MQGARSGPTWPSNDVAARRPRGAAAERAARPPGARTSPRPSCRPSGRRRPSRATPRSCWPTARWSGSSAVSARRRACRCRPSPCCETGRAGAAPDHADADVGARRSRATVTVHNPCLSGRHARDLPRARRARRRSSSCTVRRRSRGRSRTWPPAPATRSSPWDGVAPSGRDGRGRRLARSRREPTCWPPRSRPGVPYVGLVASPPAGGGGARQPRAERGGAGADPHAGRARHRGRARPARWRCRSSPRSGQPAAPTRAPSAAPAGAPPGDRGRRPGVRHGGGGRRIVAPRRRDGTAVVVLRLWLPGRVRGRSGARSACR